MEQSYKVSADQTDSGPVLVTFVERTGGTGEVFKRRPSTAPDALVLGAMRRCVPVSQLEAAIRIAHSGPVKTGHVGQDATFTNCNRMFDGIPRKLSREFVRRCKICQTKQPKRYKAPLQPLVSHRQWERVVMDLVDFGDSGRSRGMRYMWHAQDHFSKYNFAAAIASKSAAEVAVCVEAMLRVTGPIKVLQCDNGTEFMGRVYELCDEWGMERPSTSSPYHPQTNGLAERSGGTIKRALEKWMQQESTQEWVDGLSRITFQLNCTVSRATKRTPHEMVFGSRPRWDSTPIAHALDATTLLTVVSDEPTLASPPSEEAVDALLIIRQRSDSTSDSSTNEQSDGRTRDPPRRTPELQRRTPDAQPRTPVRPGAKRPEDKDAADAVSYAAAAELGNTTPNPPDVLYDAEGDTANYIDEEAVNDLDPQQHGPLTERIGDELDSGPYRFARRGTHGDGRCLLSAWLECNQCSSGENSLHPHLAKLQIDGLRGRLLSWLLALPADRQAGLRRMLLHVGNSGAENRGEAEDSSAGVDAEQACWDTLVRHLGSIYCDLGWEALAALSEMERCNVLVFAQVSQSTTYAANTKEAKDNWTAARQAGTAQSEAARMGKRRAGGDWTSTDAVRTVHVLVPRQVNESWPFRVIWHRSQIAHSVTGHRESTSAGGRGHFESLVAYTPTTPEDCYHDEWQGVFSPNTAMHEHLTAIGTRVMCTEYNGLARVRMEEDYNRQTQVAHFTRLNSVGLRRASLPKNQRKGGYRGFDCLPCIIYCVNPRQPVKQFGLLSEYGALDGWYTADQLVTISLHNFPELTRLYAQFTAAQLCAASSPDFQPIRQEDHDVVSAEDAFAQRDRRRQPAAVNNARRRAVTSRAASVAAETSLINAQLDRRAAPSLHTLSSQPAVPPTDPVGTQRPVIVQVLQHIRDQTRFKVLWGAPTHDWGWLTKSHLMQWEEHRAVMEAYAIESGIDLYADTMDTVIA